MINKKWIDSRAICFAQMGSDTRTEKGDDWKGYDK